MDRTNTDVFSPVRNFDGEKIKRQSDSFSEFLKGPDVFKKKSVNSEILEHVNENTPVNNILNKKSTKTHQKNTAKSETYKSVEELASSTSIHDVAFTISREKIRTLKKDKPKNTSLSSKKNDKLKPNQQCEAGGNNKKICDSRSARKNTVNLVKSSSQSVAVSIASGSKETKKADKPSSVSHHNPLSKSGVLEKLINDAVESQVDDIRKALWSHHLNLLKAIHNIQDEVEQRRAENTTMFKIMEQLLEENRLLRDALLARP